MKFTSTDLAGAQLIEFPANTDARGGFVKTFHEEIYARQGVSLHCAEEYYSTSRKGVVRGMHLQTPPFAVDKLVYCPGGAVLDVIVDLRRGSPTYGRHATHELSGTNHLALFIPAGIAHGFLSLADDSLMVYQCSAVYSPTHDTGIHWASFGFTWPVAAPVVSARDRALVPLGQFESPFA